MLAVKGGTGSYNVTGGSAAGGWAITGISVATHYHSVAAHNHVIIAGTGAYGFDVNGNYIGMTRGTSTSAGRLRVTTGDDYLYNNLYTDIEAAFSTGSTAPAATGSGLWRPAAAVGTLQYPDLS